MEIVDADVDVFDAEFLSELVDSSRKFFLRLLDVPVYDGLSLPLYAHGILVRNL